MKRYRIWILAAVLLALLVACNTEYDTEYRLLRDEDEIVKISIIALDYEYADYRMVGDVICGVENIDSFVTGLKQLPCKARYGGPLPTHLHGKATGIKIDYADGFYELIAWNDQSMYDPIRDGIYVAAVFGRIFDEQQFLAFLAKYMKTGDILPPRKK